MRLLIKLVWTMNSPSRRCSVSLASIMLGSVLMRCSVDVFKFDPDYAANEEMYKELKTEILGEESSEEESGAEGDDDDDSEDEEVNDGISLCFLFTP